MKYNSQKYERNNEWVIYREDIIQETILAIYESCGEIVKKFYFDTGLNILRMEYIKKNILNLTLKKQEAKLVIHYLTYININ